MDPTKRSNLESAGYRFVDAEEFLGLTPEEARIVDLRVTIGLAVRHLREGQGLTQKQLAARIKTTQPRIARLEAASPDVSLDQMFRGYFAVGGSLSALALDQPAPPSRERRASAKTQPAKIKRVPAKRAKA